MKKNILFKICYKYNKQFSLQYLTLSPLTWKIWRAPNNASRLQMGFNSAFKGLIKCIYVFHVFF